MTEHQDTATSPTVDPFPGTQRQLEFTPTAPPGFTPATPPGTEVSTLAHTPGTSNPPTHGDLQARVDIMLQDINTANAEKLREHQEKLEAQRQLNELAAKYDNLIRRLEAREAQPEPRQAASHHSHSTHGKQRRMIHVDIPLHPRELQEGSRPPQPVRSEEQVAESGRQDTPLSSFSCGQTRNPPHDSTNLLARLEQLEARIQLAERLPAHTVTRFAERPGPFTTRILSAVRPPGAKSIKVDRYDGLADPFLHMDSFRSATAGKGYNDDVRCLMFQETLTGEAMSWFFELKPHSINSFQALVNAFGSRFILMTDGYHTTGQLFKVNQGESETLRSFVTRWRTATSRCRDLDKNLAFTAFKEGLVPGPFLYELNAHPPTDYEALMEMAVLHAQA